MGTATRMVYFGRVLLHVPQKGSLKSEILPPLASALVSDAIVRCAPIVTPEASMFATYLEPTAASGATRIEAARQCRFLSDAGGLQLPQRTRSIDAIKATRCGSGTRLRQKRVFEGKYYLCESSIRASTRHSLARLYVPWHTFSRGNFGFLSFEIAAIKARNEKSHICFGSQCHARVSFQ